MSEHCNKAGIQRNNRGGYLGQNINSAVFSGKTTEHDASDGSAEPK